MQQKCATSIVFLSVISTSLALDSTFNSNPDQTSICMDGCVQLLLGMQQASDLNVICNTYRHFQVCAHDCPGGSQMLDMVEQIAPTAVKAAQDICQVDNLGLQESQTPAPGFQTSVPDFASKCVGGCEHVILPLLSGKTNEDEVPDMSALCTTWDKYAGCVSECTQGAELLDAFKNQLPNIFKMLEEKCNWSPPAKASANNELRLNQFCILIIAIFSMMIIK